MKLALDSKQDAEKNPPAAFSTRKNHQRTPLGEQAVLAAWGGRVRNAMPPVLAPSAALLDGLFEHPEAP